MRTLPAAKRMRLSKVGELRALSRLQAERAPERQRETWLRISDLWRFEMELQDLELNEGVRIMVTNYLGDKSDTVTIDNETTKTLYAAAWSKLEEALVDANAAYNGTAGDDYFDRASILKGSLQEAARYADVLYTLTAVPLPDEEADA